MRQLLCGCQFTNGWVPAALRCTSFLTASAIHGDAPPALRQYAKKSDEQAVLVKHELPKRNLTPEEIQSFNSATDIIRRLRAHGHAAYIIGGWVRDHFMQRSSPDIDIATSASPMQMQKLFRNTQGLPRNTVRVPVMNETFEVTMFRGYQRDSSLQAVRLDAEQRDFTMNALYYDPLSGEVIDFVGGVADIQAGVLAGCKNPAERLRDDPVRVLRAVRFLVAFKFKLAPTTASALKEIAPLCCPEQGQSGLRLWREFAKMAHNDSQVPGSFIRGLNLAFQLGLLQYLLPFIKHDDGLQQALEAQLRLPANLPVELRIAALLPPASKLVDYLQLISRFKVGEQESANIQLLAKLADLSKQQQPPPQGWVDFYASPQSQECLEVMLAWLPKVWRDPFQQFHRDKQQQLAKDITSRREALQRNKREAEQFTTRARKPYRSREKTLGELLPQEKLDELKARHQALREGRPEPLAPWAPVGALTAAGDDSMRPLAPAESQSQAQAGPGQEPGSTAGEAGSAARSATDDVSVRRAAQAALLAQLQARPGGRPASTADRPSSTAIGGETGGMAIGGETGCTASGSDTSTAAIGSATSSTADRLSSTALSGATSSTAGRTGVASTSGQASGTIGGTAGAAAEPAGTRPAEAKTDVAHGPGSRPHDDDDEDDDERPPVNMTAPQLAEASMRWTAGKARAAAAVAAAAAARPATAAAPAAAAQQLQSAAGSAQVAEPPVSAAEAGVAEGTAAQQPSQPEAGTAETGPARPDTAQPASSAHAPEALTAGGLLPLPVDAIGDAQHSTAATPGGARPVTAASTPCNTQPGGEATAGRAHLATGGSQRGYSHLSVTSMSHVLAGRASACTAIVLSDAQSAAGCQCACSSCNEAGSSTEGRAAALQRPQVRH